MQHAAVRTRYQAGTHTDFNQRKRFDSVFLDSQQLRIGGLYHDASVRQHGELVGDGRNFTQFDAAFEIPVPREHHDLRAPVVYIRHVPPTRDVLHV